MLLLKKRIWRIKEHLRWLLLKGRPDFKRERERERERGREKERERERDLKSTAADKNSIKISYINAIKQKRSFY